MTGTWALVRFNLRRDRWLLPLWIIGLAVLPAFSVASVKDLYPTVASRVEASDTMNATASLIALYGRIYDPTSLGALSLIKLTAFGSALIAVVFVFITVRHTRTEEESGRVELLAAGVVGRFAPLAAALVLGVLTSALLGLLTTLGLGVVGLAWTGALSFGLAWALSGIVFTMVAAVAAQITVSHRVAIGISVGIVGLAYLLRAIGDLETAGPGLLSWLSPIGWTQQIRPFAGDRWGVAVIPVIASLALASLAFALRNRRDLGSGLLPDRLGPARGRLGSVEGLAWRLQRGTLIAWLAGLAVMGLILGSIAHTVTGLLSSPQMQRYVIALGGEQGFIDAFLAAEIAILGSIVGAYAVTAVSRLHSEEAAGRAEPIVAAAVTRRRWAFSHYGLALAGIAVALVIAGAATGIGHGVAVGDIGPQTLRLTLAALATVPAAWVMASLVLAMFGWVPRATTAAWGLLVAFIVLGEFGVLWNLPSWVLDISPFSHSPRLPGGNLEPGQLIGLTAVAVFLAVLGLIGLRRRTIPR